MNSAPWFHGAPTQNAPGGRIGAGNLVARDKKAGFVEPWFGPGLVREQGGPQGRSNRSQTRLSGRGYDSGYTQPSIANTCLRLLELLETLGREQDLLNAEHLISAPDQDVASVLEELWTLRQCCDEMALVLHAARPVTRREATIKRNVLLAYASLTGADDIAVSILIED